jgi:hypothetical protein
MGLKHHQLAWRPWDRPQPVLFRGAIIRGYLVHRDSARSPAFRFPDGSHIFPFAALLESECLNFRYLVYVALSFHPASVVKGKSREHVSEYRYAKYDGGATYLISINFDFAAIGTQAVRYHD